MCDIEIDLIDIYNKRFLEIIYADHNRKGGYYDKEKKYWIFYKYKFCSELLNSPYISKKRMHIPLKIFNEDQGLVEHFLSLINLSIIFRDDVKSECIKLIHQNYKEIDISRVIKKSLESKGSITESDLIKINNSLASALVGFSDDDFLTEHALNVGMLFDGRVDGKEHFISIAKSFLIMFESCKKNISHEKIIDVDKYIADIVITYVAAHQTTMQLITAALYDISKFNFTVTKDNVRDIIIEASRLHSPVLSVGRVITQEIDYNGFQLSNGDKALFYTGMANFDPHIFKNPFVFSPGRTEKPLSFGTGIHMCIGMGVALSIATVCVDFICSYYKLKQVNILEVAEGVSALGAIRFNIEVEKK